LLHAKALLDGIPDTQLPTVITGDSSMNREFNHTIVDWVNTKAEKEADIGFLQVNSRVTVIASRGKMTTWFVSGPLQGKLDEGVVFAPNSSRYTLLAIRHRLSINDLSLDVHAVRDTPAELFRGLQDYYKQGKDA